MGKLVRISEAAKISGFSKTSLDRWSKTTLKPDYITPSGQRYYDVDKLTRRIDMKSEDRYVVGYCRVSSSGQKSDLDTQIEAMKLYCTTRGYQFKIISDIGSGINYNKEGLLELIQLIIDAKISKIVITDKDRLLRLGYDLIKNLCDKRNIEIEVINQSEKLGYEKELTEDLLLILTVFSARMNGLKSHRNKRLVENLKKELSIENKDM